MSGAGHAYRGALARLPRGALGVVLGVVARAWLWTLRLRVVVDEDAEAARAEERPWVLAFLHGRQFPLLAWRRRRRTLVLVSLSVDGAMQARSLRVLGFEVLRGSSSRGGARGLAALVRRLRGPAARDAAFAIDGPRGPFGVAKPGTLYAARRAGAVVVPMGAAVASGRVLARAWDRFVLPWPFARVVVTLGKPRDPWAMGEAELALDVAREVARAEAILAGEGRRVVRSAGVSGSLECDAPSGCPTHHGFVQSSLARRLREEKVDHA